MEVCNGTPPPDVLWFICLHQVYELLTMMWHELPWREKSIVLQVLSLLLSPNLRHRSTSAQKASQRATASLLSQHESDWTHGTGWTGWVNTSVWPQCCSVWPRAASCCCVLRPGVVQESSTSNRKQKTQLSITACHHDLQLHISSSHKHCGELCLLLKNILSYDIQENAS